MKYLDKIFEDFLNVCKKDSFYKDVTLETIKKSFNIPNKQVTLDWYKVYDVDNVTTLKYIEAYNVSHSKLLLAIELQNPEIFLSDYFNSVKVSVETIQKERRNLYKELEKLPLINDYLLGIVN